MAKEWVLHHYRLAMQMMRSSYDERSLRVFDELVAGKSISDVATAFDLTAEAVRKIKQRVKERLREIVANQIHEEDCDDEQ